MARWLGDRLFYGWVVVGVTVLTLLVSAGVRSAPGILIRPIEIDLGWSRAAISFAVSIGLLLYGFSGPFAGRLMDRVGPRLVVLGGLAVMGTSTIASATMTEIWQLNLFWGVLSGVGTGIASAVLGATVATRWFVARRGLVVGIFGAATSAGQLVFVPGLMWLVVSIGWRGGSVVLGIIGLAVLVPVLLLMRNDPGDLGLRPYGAPAVGSRAPEDTDGAGLMRRAIRVPEFWLLAGSFFVCGATSSGLIGTHLIPHSIEHGIPEITAAGILALIGAMNFMGTVASGWLTDRYDPRKLLACYYSLRGLSLFFLPFATDLPGMIIFAIVFGLDYIATVPPTVSLVSDIFGRRHVGSIFGWVFFSHQVGAALAAYLGGVVRVALGDYQVAFLAAGVVAMLGGLMASRIKRSVRVAPAVAIR